MNYLRFTIIILSLFAFMACSQTSIKSYIKKADQLVMNNKTEDAIILYQKAIKKYPGEPVLYLNQAALLRKQKKFTPALRNYHVALNLTQDSIWPYLGLIKLYIEQNKLQDAKEMLKTTSEKFTNYGAVDYYSGLISYQLKNGEAALNHFNAALDKGYKKLANVYYYRGLTFETLLKNKERAKLDYESFLKSNPKDQLKVKDIKKRLETLGQKPFDF